MLVLCLLLAVLLIVLWSKVAQHSINLRNLGNRIDLLDRKAAEIARAMDQLRAGSTTAAQPVVPKPAPAAKPSEPVPMPKVPVPLPVLPPAEPPRTKPPATPPIQPTLPPEPALPPPSPRVPAWKLPEFDWESLVGVQLFSWIAGVMLLVGVVLFLGYASNQGWLIPQVRMVMGLLAGTGLLALCELKAARRYPITANAMDASAIAILFSTFYAARARWDLIGSVPAFLFMVLITALAVMLSIRRDSMFIALLGLLGGFSTPALLSTGENSPFSLFTYLLLLNGGLAYVASRKRWPLLTTLSLVFTVVYQWGWVFKFLTASQLPTALGVFLIFPILAFAMAALGCKEESRKSWISLYGQTANVTALLPLLFTVYLAAVPGYGHRYVLLFGFLFLLDAGFFAIASAQKAEILHFTGGLSTILVSAIWLGTSYSSDALPAILLFMALFVFFYLAAPLVARHFNRPFSEAAKWTVYAAPLLLFMFPALAAIEPACESPELLFGILFLLMLGISAYALFAEEGTVYFIASLFALTAEAIWAHKFLVPGRLSSALALFAVFGLLFIAVPVLAKRWNRKLRPEPAGASLLLISIGLLAFLATGPVAPTAIWGLALLMMILNVGLFWQSAECRIPALAIGGTVLSWIILGILWASIPMNEILIPAMVVMAGYAIVAVAGNIWLQKRMPGSGLSSDSMFLGLAGHLFLAIVAAQSSLSVPPWPFFCVLLVLDLAIGFSALYLRRNDLHLAAMAASAVLLMIWVGAAKISPWPAVAILSAGALSLLSFAWIYFAGRAGLDRLRFSVTAAVTVFLAEIVTIIATQQPGAPGIGFVVMSNVLLLIALLGLAWIDGRHEYLVIAVPITAAAVVSWYSVHGGPELWRQLLLFSAAVYIVFIAYPLLLGRRSGRAAAPYVAAVLASVSFFFEGRYAILQAGGENIIGILPVTQALLLGILVTRLLRIEPRGERSLGRLAFVAGGALAFVTVAIPLQLENEWITIGWALEAAALAWLYGKIPHRGLLYATAGLFAAVFVRLALNPFVLSYEVRTGIRIWNWYLYTYLVSSAAMIFGARLLAKTRDVLFPEWPRLSKLIPGGAIILLFLLLNVEIADYFSTGPTITFNFTSTLAQDLTYTLAWAVFGLGLLATGILVRSQPARIASLGLLVATIFKCFIHDLDRLGELYRVASFIGLGVCLALVALALQKFVFSVRKREE